MFVTRFLIYNIRMIRFDIITIFPNIFESYFESSILGRAQKRKLISVRVHDLRSWATDKHHTTDDAAYGGISGMVMKVEPIYRAVQKFSAKGGSASGGKTRTILLSAKGKQFNQAKAKSLARYDHIILIAGHYKGVDERVAKYIADEELSIGEYVLTGGELPAMVIVDAVSRMIPGVVGDSASKEGESFSTADIKKEHPVYTRPEVFEPQKGKSHRHSGTSWRVPKVLLSGDHKKIEEWRKKHSK